MPVIYLDNHATTKTAPEVLEALLPYMTEHYGNPHSPHAFGWATQKAVEKARDQVAKLLKVQRKEITFTASATESTNLALKGLFLANKEYRKHIITSNVEHSATLKSCLDLEELGAEITYLKADSKGRIHIQQIKEAIREDTLLVSLILANNEIGTILNFKEIASLCQEQQVFCHFDAVQAIGKIAIDLQTVNCDLLSLSGHKFYGPKGVGALFTRHSSPRIRLKSIISGGGQENAIRSGTLNVPGIVGLGKACELAMEKQVKDYNYLAQLQSFFRTELSIVLQSAKMEFHFNGDLKNILPNNISLSLQTEDMGTLRNKLSKNFAFSTGSACASQVGRPSHVLMALGFDENMAKSTFRFGLSPENTRSELEQFCQSLAELLTNF